MLEARGALKALRTNVLTQSTSLASALENVVKKRFVHSAESGGAGSWSTISDTAGLGTCPCPDSRRKR